MVIFDKKSNVIIDNRRQVKKYYILNIVYIIIGQVKIDLNYIFLILKLNDLEKEIEYLLGWYGIKRKYISGIVLTVIGIIVLIIDFIFLFYLIPGLYYYYTYQVYNGPIIRLYVVITMGCIGGLLLLIGVPYLISTTIKKKQLYN